MGPSLSNCFRRHWNWPVTQLHDALLATPVSVMKLIGCSLRTALQFSSSAMNRPQKKTGKSVSCNAIAHLFWYIGLLWFGDAENARPENDGQRKLWVWKMQEWKMTDKLFANCEHNYGVWKMQEYKSSWVPPTHTVYIKEAVRDTLESSTDMSSARPENDGQRKLWVFSN